MSTPTDACSGPAPARETRPGDAEHRCVTCRDDGTQMRVLAVDVSRSLALCSDSAGGHQAVEIALVEPVDHGDLLLVHAGTALLRIDGPSAEEER